MEPLIVFGSGPQMNKTLNNAGISKTERTDINDGLRYFGHSMAIHLYGLHISEPFDRLYQT